MRIGFVIGALHSGGAERQLVDLAVGLFRLGHEVEVFAYDGEAELDAELKENGVSVVVGSGGNRLEKFHAVRAWVSSFDPELIQGFMKRASSLAVLANVWKGDAKIIATDYSTATYGRRQISFLASMLLFKLAAGIVTETDVNRENMIRYAPWLSSKVEVIRNGVDLKRFSPGLPLNGGLFTFLCVGTVWRAKNPVNVVRAAALLREKTARPFVVRWVGRRHAFESGAEIREYAEATRLVGSLGLGDIVCFPGPEERIERAYQAADVLLHVSVQDGIPNAVVEGMASRLPLVVSPVSDLPLIVKEGNNGFVSEGFDAESIAGAMLKMIESSSVERETMGRRSRELAERWFGMGRFVGEYEKLYRRLIEERA